MMMLDMQWATPYLYVSIEDKDPLVRRDVVYMLLEALPEDAIPHLEKVIADEHWEVRFYAKQAIRLIEEKLSSDEPSAAQTNHPCHPGISIPSYKVKDSFYLCA
jgi:HEAT repeat protein